MYIYICKYPSLFASNITWVIEGAIVGHTPPGNCEKKEINAAKMCIPHSKVSMQERGSKL